MIKDHAAKGPADRLTAVASVLQPAGPRGAHDTGAVGDSARGPRAIWRYVGMAVSLFLLALPM